MIRAKLLLVLPLTMGLLWLPMVGWAKTRTVSVSGTAALANLTAEEAQSLALKRARQNAVEAVCGVSVQAQTFVKNNMLLSDFIYAVAYGHIISEKILGWEVDVSRSSERQPPQIAYTVSLKATVRQEKGKPDPYYQVNCRLNQKVFRSGEEMVIRVTVTEASYISVLNYTADGSVVLLYPNQIRRDNYVRPLTEFQIPADADRRDVLRLEVYNLPGHRKDTEFIQVLATRKPLHLLEGRYLQGHYGVMQSPKMAATEIARLISAIPLKDRAEHTVVYEIIAVE